MIDFPASPTIGQQFTAAGVVWIWDGVKWAASGLSVAYLPLTGGTLTGNLSGTSATFSGVVTANAGIMLNGTSGNRYIIGRTSGSTRWAMFLGDGTAESGNNAGSNFSILNYSDSQATLGTPLAINRASGIVTIPNRSAPQAIGDNRVLNGDMRIDQRNNGVGVIPTVTPTSYTLDRWQFGLTQPSKFAIKQASNQASTIPFGFPNFLQCTSQSAFTPAATDTFYIGQRIEADMISDFAWGTPNAQPVTLSFWANSTQAGTYGGVLTGANPLRSYAFSYPLAGTGLQKVVVTIPGDTGGTWAMSGNAYGVEVRFDLGSGANFRIAPGAWTAGNMVGVIGAVNTVATNAAIFALTGVKLEIGNVATPFNRQSLAKSMADCQRYFQALSLFTCMYNGGTGQFGYVGHTLPVAMRAVPTVAILPATLGNVSNCTSQAGAPQSTVAMMASMTITAPGQAYYAAGFTLNAEL
jgi:hypothetical protein